MARCALEISCTPSPSVSHKLRARQRTFSRGFKRQGTIAIVSLHNRTLIFYLKILQQAKCDNDVKKIADDIFEKKGKKNSRVCNRIVY